MRWHESKLKIRTKREEIMPARDDRFDVSTGSAIPKLFPGDALEIWNKNMEVFLGIQKELTATFERAGREWPARIEAELALDSDFAKKLLGAKTGLEVMVAYQDWFGRRMEAFAKDGQKIIEDTRTLLNTGARFGNGKSFSSS
jgi:hypothetical protein